MKRFSRLAASLIPGFFGVTQLLSGAPCCAHTNCLDRIEAFGQALYWRWTGARTEFAAVTGQAPGPTDFQTTREFDPEYQWGFRVGLGWHPCHCSTYAEVSYLRFARTASDQAFGFPLGFGVFLTPFGNTFGLCILHQFIGYQNVDFTVGAFVWCNQRLALQIYGGGRWVYLEQSAVLDGPNNPGPGQLRDFSKFNGGALKMGLGAEFSICGLKAFAAFDVLPTLGTASGDSRFQDPDDLFLRPEENAFRTSIGRGLKVGLKYECVCGCCRLGAEAGYESQTYVDVMRTELRIGDREGDVSHADGGFAGPYIGLKVGY